jgi:hypothetical protein
VKRTTSRSDQNNELPNISSAFAVGANYSSADRFDLFRKSPADAQTAVAPRSVSAPAAFWPAD